MKKLAYEMLLILALSLCISLLYNMLSPGGLRILPKKKAQTHYLHLAAVEGICSGHLVPSGAIS